MSTEMLTAFSALTVALVTAVGGIAQVIVGRRQPRRPRGAERRDDFTAVTDRLEKHIARLEHEAEQDRQQAEQDRARIGAQDFALRYIAGWARSLVAYMRQAQLEPPPPPQPVPEEVRPYLHDIGS
ncbi:hypothetical protein ACFYQQ_01305 [Streptomyces sp. NPDC005496]|uniref:hypothetical protein n=1 Tax=unclassified Streptomyces TaxID=2593676 RepID=UPI0033BC6DF8